MPIKYLYMKKLYTLLFAVLISAFSSAQLQTQLVSPGVYKITYGATKDYSLYNPGNAGETFYVHTYVDAADNSTGNLFLDDWYNSTVTMTYDSGIAAYVGSINLNTKTFTYGNNKIPGSTNVTKVGIVFKDLQSGANKQSAGLAIYIPTTTLSTLATSDLVKDLKKSFVAGSKLYTQQKGTLDIAVYDMSGRIITRSQSKSSDNGLELNVNQKGIYMVKVSNGSQTEVVKFIK